MLLYSNECYLNALYQTLDHPCAILAPPSPYVSVSLPPLPLSSSLELLCLVVSLGIRLRV